MRKIGVIYFEDPEAENGKFPYLVEYQNEEDVQKFKSYVVEHYDWRAFDDWVEVYKWLDSIAITFDLRPIDFTVF